MVSVMPERRVSALIQESFALQEQDAIEAGSLGFLGRLMVQATMPHRDPGDVRGWGRQNGSLSLTMQPGMISGPKGPVSLGLPYGSIPRLLLAWVTTEAVRTKTPSLVLGNTLSDFLRQLDLARQGGARGDITRLQTQMRRLFAASISCSYSDAGGWADAGFRIASRSELWWDPKRPEQTSLWESTVTLSHEFFEEITTRPVPVDMRALQALRRSPLALDMYSWLTWRMSTLRGPATVPWQALEAQFGSDYSEPRQFRRFLIRALAKVRVAYPQARVEPTEAGLRLHPSPTHVPRRIA